MIRALFTVIVFFFISQTCLNKPINYKTDERVLFLIENGSYTRHNIRSFMCLAVEVNVTNNVEGSEWICELIDKIMIKRPYVFIREYNNLSEKEKEILDDCIGSMSEDAKPQLAYQKIKHTRTVYSQSKERILNMIILNIQANP